MHHDGKRALASLVLSLAALGCSSTHETVSTESGVYDLTIASEHDACSPMRATGPMGTAGVVATGTLLTVSVPDLTASAPMLLALNSGSGYSEDRTEPLTACTAATLTRTYSIVGASATGFDVAYHESWQGMSTCGAEMRAIMPAAPSADCSADLVMHYALAMSCASPCSIQLAVDGSAACHC